MYISDAHCVAEFELDADIRYRLADIEKAFGAVVSGQAKSTNVSESMPPPIARFTLRSGQKQVQISQVSAQLALSFPDKQPIRESFDVVHKNALLFWSGFYKLKRPNERKNIGIVISINIPSSMNKEAISKKIFQRYSTMPPLGEVASANMRYGFLVESLGIFKNISFDVYEIRSGTVPGSPGVVSIDLETLPVQEKGFEIKLDINTKPKQKLGQQIGEETSTLVLDELRKFVFDDGKRFLEW